MTDEPDIDLDHAGPRVAGDQRGALWLEVRALLRLALPLAATQLAQMAILATDTIMLGHLSKQALAAAALGNNVYIMAWLLSLGPASAVPALIAHARGASARKNAWRRLENSSKAANSSIRRRDHREIRNVVRMGLWSSALVTLPLLLALACTGPLLAALGEAPGLAAQAGVFMSALMWGLPFAVAYQVLRNFSTAVDRPLMPLIVAGVAILFNAGGDYALIFGHFGAPRLGLLGSGIASALSNFFTFAAMLGFTLWQPALARFRIGRRLWQPHWAHLAELFHLGLPIGMTMLFEITLFVAATLIMGLFGTDTLAAHQIAITIPSITFMVPLGIGMAATVRVGLAAGAGDATQARRAGFAALGLASVFMAFTSALLLSFPRAIAGVWLPDVAQNAGVLALAAVFLRVAAGFQVADGLQVTASLSLRGLKDARAPMWLAAGSYWLCGFPVCLILGFYFGMKGLGVWIGLALGLFMAAATLVGRFHALSKRGPAQIQQQEE